jgi:hypothetical protein
MPLTVGLVLVGRSYAPNSTTLFLDREYAAEALELWETNKTGDLHAKLCCG